jgi:hypothetical protein
LGQRPLFGRSGGAENGPGHCAVDLQETCRVLEVGGLRLLRAASGWPRRSRWPGCRGTARGRWDYHVPPTAAGSCSRPDPGAVDRPGGDQAGHRGQVAIGGQFRGGFERSPDGLLGRIQQLVDLLVISEMRGGIGCRRQGRAGADHSQRQVVVEMGIHARQRELDRFDPRHGPPGHQRPSRQRHRRRSAGGTGRGEVQVRERHIQLGHKRRVGEEALASWLSTCRVTSRYIRLKHASPSAAGSAAAIASIRAIAPATETTGASGAGRAADMAVTIRSPSSPPHQTLPSRPSPALPNAPGAAEADVWPNRGDA